MPLLNAMVPCWSCGELVDIRDAIKSMAVGRLAAFGPEPMLPGEVIADKGGESGDWRTRACTTYVCEACDVNMQADAYRRFYGKRKDKPGGQ